MFLEYVVLHTPEKLAARTSCHHRARMNAGTSKGKQESRSSGIPPPSTKEQQLPPLMEQSKRRLLAVSYCAYGCCPPVASHAPIAMIYDGDI